MLTVEVAFKGAPEDKKIAGRIYDLMQGHGRFMALDVPIRVSIESLVQYLATETPEVVSGRVESVAAKNREIFSIEENEAGRLITTSRVGKVSGPINLDGAHTYAQRFMTPLPKPEVPVQPVRVRPRIDERWATIDQTLPRLTDDYEGEYDDDLDLDETLVASVADEFVRDIIVIDAAPDIADVEEALPIIDEPAPARVLRVPNFSPTLFDQVDNVELADVIGDRLRADPRVANFGDQWMLEERVPRFSRGDLRRMKDYIQEQEQPLTDDVLAQDVLGGRPGAGDFDVLRFGINFRLSREHREFDFVGTPNQRFWSTSSLPQIGTTRRKPNEIGTDYRYLIDEAPDASAYRTSKSVDHVLSFYEYYLGLLPYDAEIQALLPAPVLPNQRSAVLTFECPQSYTTYLVELRYATPNRGGFILGLDDFYNENLVPGAMITIERTDNDGHYLVRYIQSGSQNGRLLELEDRRQRYVFRPTTYACGVLDEFLISEDRFPNFASEKPLDEKARRRPEAVIAATFERINHKSDGPGFVATFADLLTGVNIERPFSEKFLRTILDNDETGAFARDPDGQDAYTYVPGPSS